MKKLGLLLVILTLLLVVCIPVAMAAEGNTIELRYDDRKDLSELIGVTPPAYRSPTNRRPPIRWVLLRKMPMF